MANLHSQDYKIKFKQGMAANINADATKRQAVEGEPHWTTDTNQLYVFDGTQNVRIYTADSNGNITLGGNNKIIGGTATTADLTLQTTSGVGATGADMHFLVGNNGATEAMTILNNGKVGVGTTGPNYKLEINGVTSINTTGTVPADTQEKFSIVYNNAYAKALFYSASSDAYYPIQTYQRARGSVASPTAVANNDVLGLFSFDGMGNSAFTGAAQIYAEVDGTPSGNNIPARFRFLVADGSSGLAERVRIQSDGNVGIGVTSPTAYLHLKAGTATANTAPLKFNSGTLNTTAEAGAMEFLTDALYFTITTGAARKTIAFETGVSGTFTTADAKTVTVTNGLITAIV